jgi:autotransporter-associated beta strand protein
VGGSVTTSATTAVGRTSDSTHGASLKILSGGSASLSAISVLDGSTFTDAGTLTGATLTLGEATGNTTGNLVLGDSTAAGAATFTGLTAPGSGAKTIVGGNASASTLTLNLAGTTTLGTSLTFGGGSGNQNNLTLDKTGAGTLVMGNGANTYSGGTIFENGGIQLGANNALGSGSLTIGTANTSLSVNSGFLKVQLSGYDQTVTGLANGNVGTIIIEANAAPVSGNNILTVNQAANTTSSFSGTLRNISTGGSGVLSLTKSGNGTLSLSAANGYTGNTTVSAGTLQLTAGSLASTAITVNSGTFAVQPGSSTTLAAGSTSTAGVGASLNLGGNTFDMTDGAISQFNLYQASDFAGTALAIGNGATLKFNLGNSNADKMVVSKAASVSGTINVTLDTSLMTAPVAGSYSLITAASGLDGGTWQFSDTGNQTKTVTVNGSAYTLTLNHGATSVYVAVAAKTASQLVFTTQPSASTVADGRNVNPQAAGSILYGTPTTADLSMFQNANANGVWTFFIADLGAGGGTASLNNVILSILTVSSKASSTLVIIGTRKLSSSQYLTGSVALYSGTASTKFSRHTSGKSTVTLSPI